MELLLIPFVMSIGWLSAGAWQPLALLILYTLGVVYLPERTPWGFW